MGFKEFFVRLFQRRIVLTDEMLCKMYDEARQRQLPMVIIGVDLNKLKEDLDEG